MGIADKAMSLSLRRFREQWFLASSWPLEEKNPNEGANGVNS